MVLNRYLPPYSSIVCLLYRLVLIGPGRIDIPPSVAYARLIVDPILLTFNYLSECPYPTPSREHLED